MTQPDIFTFEIDWSGIRIAVSYEPCWLAMKDFETAHLQVRSIAPERAPLPITETGYRSLFTEVDLIDEHGGPVAFVLAWLDAEAQSHEWQQAIAARRQLSLF